MLKTDSVVYFPQQCEIAGLKACVLENEEWTGMVSKFADDTKIGGRVDSEESYLRLQRDVDQLGRMANGVSFKQMRGGAFW